MQASVAAQQQLFSFLWWGSRSRSFAAATEATSSCHQQISSIKQTSAVNYFVVIADIGSASFLSRQLLQASLSFETSNPPRNCPVLNIYYTQQHISVSYPSLFSDVLYALTADVMASLNLSTNGPSIKSSYQGVVNGALQKSDSPTYALWALFTVQAPLMNAFQGGGASESILKVETKGGKL